jgi:serine/threonine-protein kinase
MIDLPVGTRIGDWTLGEALGTGGFASLHRATDPGGRAAAIKVLHAEHATTTAAAARFLREVAIIRRIAHPNLVEIYDAGQLADGRPYYAMELLHGMDLAEHLATQGRLAPGPALAVLEPLCSALSAAHELGVVHRDLKAANVFLDRSSGAERVVLLDFGIAKLPEAADLTASRQILGSPASMAPEQLRGAPVDLRTDVYGLGALAYHMLTGQLPFDDASVTVIQYLHQYASRPAPSSLARVPAALDELVTRAMSVEPADRPASALAFAAAFRAALATPTAVALPAAEAALAARIELRPLPGSAPQEALQALLVARDQLRSGVRALGLALLLDASQTVVAACPVDERAPARERAVHALCADLARQHRAQLTIAWQLVRGHLIFRDGAPVAGPLCDIASWAARARPAAQPRGVP